MPEHAMSFVPNLVESPDGQQVYDFENAQVKTSQHREEVIQEHQRNPKDGWHEDIETGETFFEQQMSQEDVPALTDLIGGEEHYELVLQWATDNLPEEAIDQFNSIIEDGDLNEVKDAMLQLQEYYENNVDKEPLDTDEVTEYIFNNVCSPQEYGEIADFVRENLSATDVDSYNDVINSGDIRTITNLIQSIQQRINDWKF